MKRSMAPMSQCRALHRLGVDAVEGDADLGEVVKQVVEQHLRRKHWQERQE